jgi:hypothetical protein
MLAHTILHAALLGWSHSVQGPPPDLQWDDYPLVLTDSTIVPAEIARLSVPERRGTPRARSITLALIRLPARRPGAAGPTLYLNGNPGGAAGSTSMRLPPVYRFLDRLRGPRSRPMRPITA